MSVHSDTKYEGVNPIQLPCGKIIKYRWARISVHMDKGNG